MADWACMAQDKTPGLLCKQNKETWVPCGQGIY